MVWPDVFPADVCWILWQYIDHDDNSDALVDDTIWRKAYKFEVDNIWKNMIRTFVTVDGKRLLHSLDDKPSFVTDRLKQWHWFGQLHRRDGVASILRLFDVNSRNGGDLETSSQAIKGQSNYRNIRSDYGVISTSWYRPIPITGHIVEPGPMHREDGPCEDRNYYLDGTQIPEFVWRRAVKLKLPYYSRELLDRLY